MSARDIVLVNLIWATAGTIFFVTMFVCVIQPNDAHTRDKVVACAEAHQQWIDGKCIH